MRTMHIKVNATIEFVIDADESMSVKDILDNISFDAERIEGEFSIDDMSCIFNDYEVTDSR